MFGLVAEPERVQGLGEVRLARRDAGQHTDVTGVLETFLQDLRQDRVSVGDVLLSPDQSSHHSVQDS